jgi:hypothetical protein
MSLLRNALFQWQTVFLLAAGLFVRLVLSPYPGFYGDANVLVQYSRVTTQRGLFAVRDMSMSELYPAGFLYHSWIVGHVLKNKLRSADNFATDGMTAGGASVAERMGARVFPIVYDLLIGATLLLVLGQSVSAQAGRWGAAIYLFNPGTVMDSALWNYDSMLSFYLLVAVFLVGAALQNGKDLLWIAAWVAAGFAMSIKLQAGMVLPLLGLLTLLTGRVKLIVLGPIALLGALAVIFAPFLLGHQWLYLRRVFVASFQSYPVTVAGAYNFWGLWFQRPVSDRLAGITLESIGRAMFLAAYLWLTWQIWRQKIVQAGGADALRRVVIVTAYAFVAPFVLLTRMHERYLAPAVAVCVLAGLLDRRLRGFMWGISTCYAVNLFAVLTQVFWHLQNDEMGRAIHISYCVVRFFCCVLNVGLFLWLARQLPKLLRPIEPAKAPTEKLSPEIESPVSSAV